jgi:hypothetical protein
MKGLMVFSLLMVILITGFALSIGAFLSLGFNKLTNEIIFFCLVAITFSLPLFILNYLINKGNK